jgi:putative nucleotidyltransferase with HDIG domain
MKPSLLFVDDDPNILDGLKRMLYPMRSQWEMEFCLSGRQALKLMEKARQDILVTDLVMPEMDGDKLLEVVQARHPETIRIVLSGHAGKPVVFKAACHAHQFLSKPTSADALRQALERVLSLRDVLINPSLLGLIAKVDTLPALPEIYQKIMKELREPNPSIKRVSELITEDLGLSASILKLVNSAFFGLRTRVSSPLHAVNLLGLDVLSALVLNVKLFSSIAQSNCSGVNLEKLWRHCLNTGLLTKAIAHAEGFSSAEQDDLYISGILHDVGKLVLLSYGHDLYKEVLSACRNENTSIWLIENRILNTSHAELGAYLLSIWGFDQEIVSSIHAHHALGQSLGNPLKASIVHAANCFEHQFNIINAEYGQHSLEVAALENLGYLSRLPAWSEVCEKTLEEMHAHEQENPDS